VIADCGTGFHATGGGGEGTKALQQSYPSDGLGTPALSGSTNPQYWTAVFQSVGINTAFALCVPN
jgi:hypothetical protein